MTVSDDAWQIARARFSVIQSLLSTSRCTRAQISEQARRAGVDTATVYRWLQRYQRSGQARRIRARRSGAAGTMPRSTPL